MKINRSLALGIILIGLCVTLHRSSLSIVEAQDSSTPTQTPTSTPSSPRPLIERASAETLFPAGLRFTLVLNALPESVRSIGLRVTTDHGFTQNVRLFFARDAFIFAPQKTMFTALMPIVPNDPAFPAPFSELRYTWTLRTHDGRLVSESRTVILQDLRWESAYPPRWTQAGGAPITLYSHNPDLALPFILVEVNRAYARLSADFGSLPDYRIVLYDAGSKFCKQLADGTLYIDSTEIGGVSMPCVPDSAMIYYRTHGFSLLRRTDALLPSAVRGIVTLIASEALDHLWVNQPTPVPWLREGLIRLYASTSRPADLTLVRNALKAGQTLSLEVLEAESPSSAEAGALWGAQAYLFTLYLADAYGANTPFNVARWIGSGGTVESYLRLILNTDEPSVFNQWRTWLLTIRADQAVRWNPYVTTTPTATPSPTAYPSVTPTPNEPTPTRTLIPSQTPLPFRAAPTFTPIPSNTPLPPGSFNRTPQPPDEGVPENDDNDEGDLDGGTRSPEARTDNPTTLLLLGGVGLAALALGIVIFTLRKRR